MLHCHLRGCQSFFPLITRPRIIHQPTKLHHNLAMHCWVITAICQSGSGYFSGAQNSRTVLRVAWLKPYQTRGGHRPIIGGNSGFQTRCSVSKLGRVRGEWGGNRGQILDFIISLSSPVKIRKRKCLNGIFVLDIGPKLTSDILLTWSAQWAGRSSPLKKTKTKVKYMSIALYHWQAV